MLSMIQIAPLKIEDKVAIGLKVDLPDSPPLLLVVGRTGFLMCGFLNMEAAEKLQVAAAMVSGVGSFDDVLDAEVKAATAKAQMKGVKPGMKGSDAVRLLL